MLYPLLKFSSRMLFWVATRRVRIENPEKLNEPGPLVLAVNHPNSFLDAVVVGTYMKNPVHFITRGDVFRHKLVRRIFESLHMIPIFRIRDGRDKLSLNNQTFEKGVEVLRNHHLLLIFVEGFCINQTDLQLPLKKGGPRMVQASWQQEMPTKVLPVWLSYSGNWDYSFSIDMRLGTPFGREVSGDADSNRALNDINRETERQLLQLHGGREVAYMRIPAWLSGLIILPAVVGAALHWPLYASGASIAHKLNGKDVHWLSMLFAWLLFLLPAYWLLLSVVLYFITGITWLSIVSFFAWPLLLKASHFLNWGKAKSRRR